MKYFKEPEVLYFLSGIFAALVGGRVLKNPKTREACVSGMAKSMKLHQEARVALQNMKEDARDMHHDAKQMAQKKNDEMQSKEA